MKQNIFRGTIVLIFLIICTATVIAPISVYHSSRPYTPEVAGLVKEYNCPALESTGKCEIPKSDPCGAEGQYFVRTWVTSRPEYDIIPAYVVSYDEKEDQCRNIECGDGVWSPTSDFGNGECCGDDNGLLVEEWKIIVAVDEENVATQFSQATTAHVSMKYLGSASQHEETTFEVPYDQTVRYLFNMKRCFVTDTEVFAVIKDQDGNFIDRRYTYRISDEESCIGYEMEAGTFDAQAGNTYTLELYKGELLGTPSEYPIEIGFDNMSLAVMYTDMIDMNITKRREYIQKISEAGDYEITLEAQEGGILNINTVSIDAVPSTFIQLNPAEPIWALDGFNKKIIQNININIHPHNDAGDCGLTYNGELCFDNYNNDASGVLGSGLPGWEWIKAGINPNGRSAQGGIISIECLGMSAVSDGYNWHICREPDTVIPDTQVDNVRCYKLDGLTLKSGEKCIYRGWNPTSPTCSDIDPETGKCLVEPSVSSCTATTQSDAYIECKQTSCRVVDGCTVSPLNIGRCVYSPVDSSCGTYKECNAAGQCIDKSCSGLGGDCCGASETGSGSALNALDCSSCYSSCVVLYVNERDAGVTSTPDSTTNNDVRDSWSGGSTDSNDAASQ